MICRIHKSTKKTNLSIKISMICITIAGLATTQPSMAEAPGGPDCGWGNMLFEGDKGGIPHTMAYLTNGLSSFNAFFGIVMGTNGCRTDGKLSYGGIPKIGLNHILDELAEDIAQGEGEALTALSLALKIEKQDRAYFNRVMHQNFSNIFSSEHVNAEQVMHNISGIISQDRRLERYLA